MKKIWLVAILLVLSVNNRATKSQVYTQTKTATQTIDVPTVEHYTLALTIDTQHHSLTGQAEISIRDSGDRALTVIPLLLYRLMEVESVTDDKGAAAPFTQSVIKFADEPAWQANAINVTLAAPLAPGQTTTLRVKYSGALFGYREVMAYVRETIGEDYSLLRAESMPYPIIAAPSYAGWRKAYQNKFDYQTEATVPAGFVAVCPGNQIGEPQTQAAKAIYRCAGPPESNSINLAIARFRVLDDSQRNLRVYALPEDAEAGNRIMSEMRRALDFYTSYFGPPPKIGTMGVRKGLTVIEIPDGWGSYALRGYIFQSAAAFKDPKRAGELYHEVGHLWNAMIAERIQRSRYFDEAFAAYFEALAVRQFEGEQAYRALLDSYRDIYIDRVNREPLGKTTAIAEYGPKEIGVFSYTKGAWSLYVLHELVGEDKFRSVIRTFLTEFGEKPADFKDFQGVAGRVSDRNLSKFFDEWIDGAASSELLLNKTPVAEIVKRY